MSTAMLLQIHDARQPFSIAVVGLPDDIMPETIAKKVYPPGMEPDEPEMPEEEPASPPFVIAIRGPDVKSDASDLDYTVYTVWIKPPFEPKEVPEMPEGADKKEWIKSLNDEVFKDMMDTTDGVEHGMMLLPKRMRDGDHKEFYILGGIPESKFKFQIENGMYEEVVYTDEVWPKALVLADAQELVNYNISPQLWRNMPGSTYWEKKS